MLIGPCTKKFCSESIQEGRQGGKEKGRERGKKEGRTKEGGREILPIL